MSELDRPDCFTLCGRILDSSPDIYDLLSHLHRAVEIAGHLIETDHKHAAAAAQQVAGINALIESANLEVGSDPSVHPEPVGYISVLAGLRHAAAACQKATYSLEATQDYLSEFASEIAEYESIRGAINGIIEYGLSLAYVRSSKYNAPEPADGIPDIRQDDHHHRGRAVIGGETGFYIINHAHADGRQYHTHEPSDQPAAAAGSPAIDMPAPGVAEALANAPAGALAHYHRRIDPDNPQRTGYAFTKDAITRAYAAAGIGYYVHAHPSELDGGRIDHHRHSDPDSLDPLSVAVTAKPLLRRYEQLHDAPRAANNPYARQTELPL